MIDSLEQVYNVGQSIANQLLEVSSDFFAFYEDQSFLQQAEKWAGLAYEYYPYDLKYYENHIVILESLGEYQKIREIQKMYQKLPYYTEMKTIKEQRQLSFSDSFFKF